MSTQQDVRPSAIDRCRIAWAVFRLEWWLEWYGAPSRVCRPMRQELTSNLRATAAEPGGIAAGVRRLGSLRELAREASQDTDRFRWERGAVVAVLVLAACTLVQVAVSVVFADGLLAAGGGTGRVLGTDVSVTESASALSFSFTYTWIAVGVLAAVVAFVLVSRPWRYRGLRRHG